MSDQKPNRKKSALGRGLGALLEDSPAKHKSEDILPEAVKTGIFEIPLEQIQVNPFQPRVHFDKDALAELAESIKIQGIIQPITVRKLDTDEYQLISGERRFQASKIAGLTQIPAYVRTANDQQMLEMALIENIQRENLNALEIAQSYQRLLAECDLKQEELGDRVGKNRTTVNNYLRLLKLPPTIQAAIRDQQLSMGHARALINIEDVDQQLAIFKKAVAEELSVRKVEALVKALSEGKPEKSNKPELDPVRKYEISKIQQRLASHFGTKVALKSNPKNKGEIKIPFNSASDLNRILEILEII
ncbi:ParB/RepB/Spo0J family partition protein [Algoriphagus halophytocola]|uniref:ParB/RepB/Spo0J family partition protein n=1 Tax=Algoriphagus halophytocola TaxID=2991499 RepID=A0ABY6MHE0_9BACT|nr:MULTISPECIES: ParB/RepB/Spo0J family partition protein [unclassified Algoriphagus]UZD22435.1 ParB/RepB/Spo0J family partition protein [Algoriphagus sp. TR-M5]WBL43695.1 ParB/RepB/Spo0J family partition protein [Algoriphagus sp. TR-M9]